MQTFGGWLKTQLSAPLVPQQIYQVSLWALNPPAASVINSTVAPVIISVNTLPDINSTNLPAGFASFTVNQTGTWTSFTNTFVFNQPTGHSALRVWIDPTSILSTSVNPTTSIQFVAYIDELSILAAGDPTFSIPNGAIDCGMLTDLAQYATPIPGVFSGPGVSAVTTTAGTKYNFNTQSLTPGTSYPIAFSYTTIGGCSGTLWQSLPITMGISAGICDNGHTLSAVGYSAGTTYTWLPALGSSSLLAVHPVGPTIYTLSTSNGTCNMVQTTTVYPCCPLSGPSSFTSSILSTSLTGATTFTSNLSIPANTSLTINAANLVFGPGVSLTINNGANLTITDSHLYACTDVMWNGITILDGGALTFSATNYDNLIEDAVTAVDIVNHTSSTLNNILSANNTTFNKNYVDIKIGNYIRNASTYPFSIHGCVFTCRDFTFSPTTWAQASLTATGLRYAAGTATTDIVAPYLMLGAGTAVLKNPYSSIMSKTAIELLFVGLTNSAFKGITIGTGASASDFNLFDSHETAIYAFNTNLKSTNNVFQNDRFGIIHSVTTNMNAELDLSASNINTGNRFWDCYAGVYGSNTYNFTVNNAIFRSTQSTSVTALYSGLGPNPYLAGTLGISIKTNRFSHAITNNEFTNLNTCIVVGLIAGTFTAGSSSVQNGIFARLFAVSQNTFSPLPPAASSTVASNNFVNRGVSISSPNTTVWSFATNSTSPSSTGVVITNNLFNRVYRAVKVNGIPNANNAFLNQITDNTIIMDDDNILNPSQRAIEFVNNNGKSAIAGNILKGTNITNTLQTLIYSSMNTGIASPSVTCNRLENAGQGFEFNSNNSNATWAGNDMKPMARGLVLSGGNGGIGVQGSVNSSHNNQWVSTASSWTGTSLKTTYISTPSTATSSPLWVKLGTDSEPINNGGTAFFGQLYDVVNGNLLTATGGDYDCFASNEKVISVPESNEDPNIDYIGKSNAYRYLTMHDSVRTKASYQAFYNEYDATSLDYFMQAEEALYAGDMELTETILENVTTTNSVEENYMTFYNLYLAYSVNNFKYDAALMNLSELTNLCLLCPSYNGACIYQARALYDRVFDVPGNFTDNCEDYGARRMQLPPSANKVWDVKIFPNPTSNQINIISSEISEIIHIAIKDVTGRSLMTKTVKTNNFIFTLDLSLTNGAYLIYISNNNNERTTKKMLIAN